MVDCAEQLAISGKDAGEVVCHPAGFHIWQWFLELCSTRGRMIIGGGGMAGIVTHPSAIKYQEIESWSKLTGIRPDRWEVRILRAMDNAFLAASRDKGQGSKRQGQDIGEYCRGRDLEACRKNYGEQLERVCSTCPS